MRSSKGPSSSNITNSSSGRRNSIHIVALFTVAAAIIVGSIILFNGGDGKNYSAAQNSIQLDQDQDTNTIANSLSSTETDQTDTGIDNTFLGQGISGRLESVLGTVAATFQSLYDADSGERTIAVKDGGISFDITKKAKYLYVDLKEDGTYFKVQDNGIDVFRVDYDKNVIVHKGATFHLLGKLKDNTGSLGNASQVLTAPGGNGSPTWEDANALTVGGLDCTNCINQDEIKDVYLFNTGDTITGDLTLNSQSDLRLADSNSSNYVAFQAPTNVSSNVTWTLPGADGSSSQTLSTDGSGTLSWVSSGVSADSLDFTDFSDTLSLDADTSIAAGAAEELTYNKTFTDATSENGFVINFTASDTTSGTTAQYGLYLDNIASTEGVDAVLVIDNSDTDDSVANGLLIIDAGGTIVDAIDASDSDITNALNIGANTILGTSAVINFNNFDVAASGQVTLSPSSALTTAIDVTDTDITNAISIGANTLAITTGTIGSNAATVIDFVDFDVSADGLIVLAPDGGGDAITVTPSAAITDALDASNSLIVNALSVGANTILGTTAVIDFTNFDVSASGFTTTKSLISDVIKLPGGNLINGHTVNSNYVSVNGGFGTGGLERLTSTGILKNISAITAGQASFATAGASFTRNVDTAVGAGPRRMAVADFNADGYMDLAMPNFTDNDVSILLNDGDGTFTKNASDEAAGAGPYEVAAVDLNGDGYPDLAVVNWNDNDVSIHINDQDGTFTRNTADEAVGVVPRAIAAADYNADGYMDLAVVHQTDDDVAILINDGDGTFTRNAADEAVGTNPNSIVAADLDGDGYPDLAVINNGADDDVSILINDGDGTFTKNGTDETAGSNPQHITAADFNEDGYIDLAVVDGSDNDVKIMINDKDGTFTNNPSDEAVGVGSVSLTAADLNGDGYQDLAVANQTDGDVSILINDQDGTFTKNASDEAVGTLPNFIVSADFNGDGFIDLANGNITDNDVTTLINDTNTLFSANAHTGVLSIGSSTFSGTTAVIDFTDFDVSNDGAITVANDGDVVALTVTPSVATTTALDVSNALIVNALSVGANTITGATAVINFTNFDVDANGQVIVADGIVTEVVAGACSDSAFTTDTDGTLCIDSTNGRIYYRYGGAWHYTSQTAGFEIPYLYSEYQGHYETDGIEIGDLVIGRINKVQEDGALHGLYETFNFDAALESALLTDHALILLPADFSLASGSGAGQSFNVDLVGAIQVLEGLSGQQFIFDASTGQSVPLPELADLPPEATTDVTADATAVVVDEEVTTDELADTGDVAGAQTEAIASEPIVYLTLADLEDLVVAGSLVVHGNTTLFGNLTVEGDVTVSGSLERRNEHVGNFTIPEGNNWAEISFNEAFAGIPTVTISSHSSSVEYAIDSVTSDGFKITIPANQEGGSQFSWHAIYQTSDEGSSATFGSSFEEEVLENTPEDITSTEDVVATENATVAGDSLEADGSDTDSNLVGETLIPSEDASEPTEELTAATSEEEVN